MGGRKQENLTHFNCDICGCKIPVLGFDLFDWKDPKTNQINFVRLCRKHKRMFDWHYANVIIPSCGALWNEYLKHLKNVAKGGKRWPNEPDPETLGPNLLIDPMRTR